MKFTRVLVLGALAAAVGAAGCSRNNHANLTGLNQVTTAAPDSNPGPPTPPGPPPPPLPVQFVGSDSTREGQTGNTFWRIGNTGNTATIHWRLQMGSGWVGGSWSSLPIEGDIRVMTKKTRDLTVPIAVPGGTPPGVYPLTMLVNRPGESTHNADGHIIVFSDSVPPPPPPPPPTPAVVFAGVDSSAGQPTITFWLLFNESDGPFNMQWSLNSSRNWPGFPINGSRFLTGLQHDSLAVLIPVPDSAAAGFNRLFMTVTRPNGLPPQTAEGDFPIFPQ